MDNFFQEVWSTLEGELREKRPGALISASAPERGSDERRFWIRAGDQSHTLILGPRVMVRRDVLSLIESLREGSWLDLLWQYGCLRVECPKGEYRLVLCEHPDSSTS